MATFAAVLALTSSVASVSAASALPSDPNYLGELTLTPSSGSLLTESGRWTAVDTASGQICPEPFRGRSFLYAVPNGEGDSSLLVGAGARASNYPLISGASVGLVSTDTRVHRTDVYAWSPTWTGNAGNPEIVPAGDYELRHTCQAGSSYDFASDKYFATTITIAADRTWTVKSSAPVKQTTQTTVVPSATTQTSTTLTATVSPDAATGTVEFKNGDNVVGSASVSNGIAATTVTGLTANTDYTFTANYSGDATHEASSGTVAVKTLAEPTVPATDTAESDLNVTVPPVVVEADRGLRISTDPATRIDFNGGTRTDGQAWTATGQLGNVTVTDDRPSKVGTAWTLSGSATKFTSGSNEIPASALGWTPTDVTGTAGNSIKGGAATDLSSAKPLATGAAVATRDATTIVGAALTLTVPSTAAAGDYTSKLTLTLI